MPRKITRLDPPFLRRIRLRDDAELPARYPFAVDWLRPDFELEFDTPITILVGENGSGKSTLIEALAALAGFGALGGSRDHRGAGADGAVGGAELADIFRAGWLPKLGHGWFFRAETFFQVARYMDDMRSPSADFLSHSHGEGFVRLFAERMRRQGLYLLDEPESALSPRRQLELMRFLHRMQQGDAPSQIVMATHSPFLVMQPGARVLEIDRRSIREVEPHRTGHFRLYQDFTADPEGAVAEMLAHDEALDW
ncbi:AAA family ATPase [Jannaschia aquimarina]|uniref:RecF_1 protein n=1 Tax=Jannaschia aquimarina TaxID=935700 RepID=A0A0D1EK32_9RHOB|nr:AAA family ATPase [Jannaschia aquimarina]KIT17929.1 DNA replication and repair protein RecF [Jannaschia aquimarina]SNT08733.1 Predicted ATPase [Jannaschia aquimarina]